MIIIFDHIGKCICSNCDKEEDNCNISDTVNHVCDDCYDNSIYKNEIKEKIENIVKNECLFEEDEDEDGDEDEKKIEIEKAFFRGMAHAYYHLLLTITENFIGEDEGDEFAEYLLQTYIEKKIKQP